MSENTSAVNFLYSTAIGRGTLRLVQKAHIDRLAVKYLKSPLSRPYMRRYIKQNGIALDGAQSSSFRSFSEFFVRTRRDATIDLSPQHLISPCDGYLSAYPVSKDSSFAIKGSSYRLLDLLQDKELSESFHGGDCLIFRLCACDYHHYCYIDSGYHGENHYIPGVLHSVQPIACETYPVYTLNRRVWTLLETDNFGPVVQTEIGALIVGGICCETENTRFSKGGEMGHFELSGSTIALFFQRGRISLLPKIAAQLKDGAETRVTQGMHIGCKEERQP